MYYKSVFNDDHLSLGTCCSLVLRFLLGARGLVDDATVLLSEVLVVLALGEDELAQPLLVELHSFELEYDGLTYDGLLLGVAHSCKKWVFQTLLQRDAIVWVEDEDLLQEVDCLGRRPRVLLDQIGSRASWELLQVLERLQVRDETFV